MGSSLTGKIGQEGLAIFDVFEADREFREDDVVDAERPADRRHVQGLP